MDPINKFLVDNFRAQSSAKTASAAFELPELTAIEKRAYLRALNDSCMDESFLAQFEGTPLYPQAIALAEQELAIEQRQLQARMARAAQRSTENFEQEHAEREGLELQKKQLLIQMHKMKVMGQGAPTPPGQAVIGEPQPGPADMGMGAAGGAPVQEPGMGASTDPTKMASLRKLAQKLRSKSAAVTDNEVQYIPEFLPGGSSYVGYQRGKQTGRPFEGMVRGALGGTGGTLVGALPGAILSGIAAAEGNHGLASIAGPLGSIGGILGGAHGTHLATRSLLRPKTEE